MSRKSNDDIPDVELLQYLFRIFGNCNCAKLHQCVTGMLALLRIAGFAHCLQHGNGAPIAESAQCLFCGVAHPGSRVMQGRE